MSNTSEFSVPEPFAPKPRSHPDESVTQTPPVQPTQPAQVSRPINVGLIIIAAATVGFAAGYAVSRYEQTLLRQSRLDEFLDYAGDWVREHGPKITDPIKQGFESTSSTVGQAFKDVAKSAPKFDQLNPFRQPPKRKPVFGLF
jgi:hypothetical protein